MAPKKNLYEVLGVPRDAPAQDIRAAHRRQLEALQEEQASLDRSEFDYRRTVLKVALETLSDAATRKSYDDKLLTEAAAACDAAKEDAPSAVALAAVPPDILARRAEALSLRADALSLRADAISIQTDAALLPEESAAPSLLSRALKRASSVSGSVLRILGALTAVLIVAQAAFAYFAARTADAEKAKAEEKLVIQEYYQTYGERPASAAEAQRLTAEREREQREARAAEREQQRIADEERRFKDESRRVGDQVSADLRQAEERMAWERRRQKAREEEEERERAAEEEQRLQREQEKWRQVLDRDR